MYFLAAAYTDSSVRLNWSCTFGSILGWVCSDSRLKSSETLRTLRSCMP